MSLIFSSREIHLVFTFTLPLMTDSKKAWWLIGLAVGVVWAQCNYTSANCAGLSPSFSVIPPSPRCSYNLPQTVLLTPSGTGSATVSFFVRLNGVGAWNAISSPATNEHTFTAGQTGNHQFMMVVQLGGCRDTVIRCYTITQRPTATFNISHTSPRCASELPISLNLNATFGATITAYQWYINGTLVGSGQNFNYTVTSVGSYHIRLVVTDTSGCIDSTSRTFVVHPIPSPSFTSSAANVCRGRRVCFTNTSTNTVPGTTYQWWFGDGGTSTQANPCHRYLTPGTYTVRLRVCNPSATTCCQDFTQTITILPGGLADIRGNGQNDTVRYCVEPGDPTTSFTVTFTNSGDCPGGGCIYTWDFGYDGVTLTTLADTPQVHTYTSYGEGWAYLTVSHPGGCTHRDSVYVVFQPTLVASSFDIPANAGGCSPYTLNITNISHTNAQTFIWDYGDGQRDTFSPPNTTNFTHIYNIPPGTAQTFQVTLRAYNACGETYTIKGPIRVVARPRINSLSANPSPGCTGSPISFTTNITFPTSSGNTIYWNFGDGSPEVTGGTSRTYTYSQRGAYQVTVRACNGCGCDTARIRLYIDSIPKANLSAVPLELCHGQQVTFTNLSNHNMFVDAQRPTPPFWEALWIDAGRCCGWACGCRCPDYVDNHDFFNFFPQYCGGWYSYYYGCCQSSSTQLPGRPMNNPPITLTNSGSNSIRTYNFLYVIGNHCGRDTQRIQVLVHPQVQARFTPSATSVCVGTPITFTNNSWGDSLTFIW
ncbi:MAG: PKD domain-containing protein, partial [Bacteroidia bacterium]|nr:PKD domain-containing protein [Bacteroidia bacterium]